VLVNGEVARVGQSVNPARDRIQVDGNDVPIAPARNTWYVLNKPAGFMTTRSDPENRRTVFELVPDVPGLTYVGRLDFLTEGVLLLTTDGEAAHRLTHPSAEVERVYVATVRGNAKAAAEAARAGVELEDGLVKPAWVNVMPMENRFWAFEIAIREGRTREIRRLCDALGLEVSPQVRTCSARSASGISSRAGANSSAQAAMLEVSTGTDVPAGSRRAIAATIESTAEANARRRAVLHVAAAARGGTARWRHCTWRQRRRTGVAALSTWRLAALSVAALSVAAPSVAALSGGRCICRQCTSRQCVRVAERCHGKRPALRLASARRARSAREHPTKGTPRPGNHHHGARAGLNEVAVRAAVRRPPTRGNHRSCGCIVVEDDVERTARTAVCAQRSPAACSPGATRNRPLRV
jgi:23S rRNA pseudouridine2605 synthase